MDSYADTHLKRVQLFPKFSAAQIRAAASLKIGDVSPGGILGWEIAVPAVVRAGAGQGAQGLCPPWEQSSAAFCRISYGTCAAILLGPTPRERILAACLGLGESTLKMSGNKKGSAQFVVSPSLGSGAEVTQNSCSLGLKLEPW